MKFGGEGGRSGRPGRSIPRKSYAEGGSEDEVIDMDDGGGSGAHVPASGAAAGGGRSGGGGHQGSNGKESQSRNQDTSAAFRGQANDVDDEEEDDEPSEYEKERQRNIARNKQLMEKLGLEKAAKSVSPRTQPSSAGKTPGSGAKKRKARASPKDDEKEWTRPRGDEGGDSDGADEMMGSDEETQGGRRSISSGGGGRQRRTTTTTTTRRAKVSAPAVGAGSSSPAAGGSSSGSSIKRAPTGGGSKGGEAKFNQNEVAYAEMLWPLLDIDGDGHVTLETLRRVVSNACAKGFSVPVSEEDVRDMFGMFAKENGEVLTEGDITMIVRDSKMHHKR